MNTSWAIPLLLIALMVLCVKAAIDSCDGGKR